MGTLFDLDAQIAAFGQEQADPETPETSAFTEIGDFLTNLGGAGLGALDTVFDVLDRFNRAKNNAVGVLFGAPSASVSQIFEQFDPFNLITPDVEAKPFTGEQLFKELGIGNVEIAGGVGTRDVGGIVFDIATDPLNLLGGFIGKGASKALKGAGRGITEFLEGAARIEGGSGEVGRLIPRAAERIAELEQADRLARARSLGLSESLLDDAATQLTSRASLSRFLPKGQSLSDDAIDAIKATVRDEGITDPIRLTVDRASGRAAITSGEDLLRAAERDILDLKEVPFVIDEATLPPGVGQPLKNPLGASEKLNANKHLGISRQKKVLEDIRVPSPIDEFEQIFEKTRALKAGEAVADLPLGIGAVSEAVAKGAVSGATLLSKHFALRNLPGAKAFDQLVFGARGRERQAVAKLNSTSHAIAKLLRKEVDNKAVVDFIESTPESLEFFAHHVLGQDPKTLRVGGGQRILADFLADPKSGKTIKKLTNQIDGLSEKAKQAVELYFEGSSDYFKIMPGKKGREIELVNRSLLHRALIDDFIRREDLRQLTHVKTGSHNTAEELAKDLLADFESMVDTKGAKTIDVYRRPDSYAERGLRNARDFQKARKISGALKKLEAEFPGMFETSLAKINFVEGRRYASAIAATDILKGVAGNDEWVRSGVLTDTMRRGGWVEVPLEQLPPGLRAQFTENIVTRENTVAFNTKTTKTLSKTKDIPAGLADDIDHIETTVREIGKEKLRFKKVTTETPVPLLMRQEIAESLFSTKGVMNQMLRPNAVSDFKKTWRGMTRVWKGWTLGPFPSWWTRNFVGNIWLNHLAGVSNPAMYAEAIPIQKKLAKVLAGNVDEFLHETIKIGDRTAPLLDVMKEMVDEGVLGGGFYTSDFGAEFLEAFTSSNPIKSLMKLDPQQNLAARYGFGINAAIEDNARIAHFLAKRREGLTAAESAFSVKTHLFDFDNLTPFEQETLRDFVPFYSWFRQNIPAQFRAVAETPHKVAQIGKMKITFDEKNRANIPDEILPEWMQSSTPLITGNVDGKLNVFMLKNWLPLADLAELDTPQKLMNFALNAAHPAIREAISQTFNWEPYFQRAIERYPGERETLFGYPIGKRYSHMLRNARLLNELDRNILPALGFKTGSKWTQELVAELSPAENIAKAGFGLKIQKIDLNRNKQFLLKKTRGQIREAQGRLRLARRSRDAANSNVLRTQISQLREKLRVLGTFDPTRHPALQGAAEGR
ncbi:MAG TPA: hypothetical protein VNA25_05080 [Phycisphaerae bacterium]|nr:hypothetical protein [Phycisphaerae bacterium]